MGHSELLYVVFDRKSAFARQNKPTRLAVLVSGRLGGETTGDRIGLA
jgi:hypothetical protein